MSDYEHRLEKLSPEKRALVIRQLQKKRADKADYSKEIIKRENLESFPLSFAQQRMWFLNQWEPDNPLYNITAAIKMTGNLDRSAFVRSVKNIIHRHEVLQAFYTIGRDGYPSQEIAGGENFSVQDIDLSNYSSGDLEIKISQLIRTEAQKPFDLSKFPLVRICLVRTGIEEHIVLFTIHHILADGWSVGIIIEEIALMYEAFVAGKPEPLPELDIQYADYAAWQKDWMQGEVLENQLNYWKEEFETLPEPLELPTIRTRPVVQTFNGAVETLQIPADIVNGVKAISKRENASLFMSLLTAFSVLLSRYSGQEDICIGSPISNRGQTKVERLIGLFVNTLAFRVDLSGSPSFLELLQQVRNTTLSAYSHQDLPLEVLVDELKLDRDLSRTPLFQVVFALQDTPLRSLELPTIEIEQIDVDTGTSKFDLTLFVEENQAGLKAMMEYNTDLFDKSMIARMLNHFDRLLKEIVKNPGNAIDFYPLLDESEISLQVNQWNDTAIPYPKQENLAALFENQVKQTPDNVALQFEGFQLTYQQLNERSNQLAHYLRKCGVKPETLVGIYLDRSIEMAVATMGVVKSDGAYMPLDPEYPEDRLAFMIDDGNIGVILSNSSLSKKLPPSEALVINLDIDWYMIDMEEKNNPDHMIDGGNLLYVMYTSGSTGLPKGVGVIHRAVARLVKNTNFSRLSSEDIFLQLAPISFDAATLEIWGPFLNGGKLVVAPAERLSMGEIAELIKQNEISILWLTASLFHLIVDSYLNDLGSLKQLLSGGDVLSVAHVRKFIKSHPDLRLTNGYGPTENTTFSTTYDIVSDNRLHSSVPIGVPIHNSSAYILDKWYNPVPIGVSGELYVGGDGLARNYVNSPELTAERFVPNPFSNNPGDRMYRTGDLCRYLVDGNIEFLGRLDFQVKIRGFRIELGEIETTIGTYPGIQNNVTTLHQDDSGSKLLVNYFVAESGEKINMAELQDFLKGKLPDYMIPARYIQLEQLPITPNGKVDRNALPEPDRSRPELEKAYIPPSTKLEKYLVNKWQEILKLDQIGIYDNFFELGGDSLKAAVLINRLQDELGEQAHVKAIFVAPTVAELAMYMTEYYPQAITHLVDKDEERGERQSETLSQARLSFEDEFQEFSRNKINDEDVALLRRIIQPIKPGYIDEQKNPPAVFILSPPRSGSTLFRTMLAGSPQLFAPPELDLLSFNSLAERRETFSETNEFWLEGVIRALMDLKRVSADEAAWLMAEFEKSGMTVQQFYRQLQVWLGEKILVDKTPVYALDQEILSRAEQYFENPLYIHLTRHPYGTIYSFVEAKLDEVFFRYKHPFSKRELAELIWIISHQNILSFLRDIPAERQMRLAFEDLVTNPENSLRLTSEFLNIDFSQAMIDPYDGDRMTSSVKSGGQMVGDFKFYLRKKIDNRAADRWKKFHAEDFLSDDGLVLANQLGYSNTQATSELIDRGLGQIQPIEHSGDLVLSFAQQRLWFLDQWEPRSPFYIIPFAAKLIGFISAELLEKSINKIIERHGVLRTTIQTLNGKPVVQVFDQLEIKLNEINMAGIPVEFREKEAMLIAEKLVQKPIDLSRGPLINATLLNLGNDESILLITIHHIIADGWSLNIFIKELAAFYNELLTGHPADLSELPVQYVDYAAWQRKWLQGEVMERQIAYWRNQLKNSPPLLELPTDYPRPPVQTQNGKQLYYGFSRELSQAIKRLSNQQEKTLFITALAAFQVLLFRYTNQTDINIGTPIANRRREEIENLIGFFVNTLVLRADLSGDPTFLELLEQVYQVTIDAYDNQDVPFEYLVDEIDPVRLMSHPPLFQVMFTFQESPSKSLKLENLVIKPVEIDNKTAKFDFLLSIIDRGDILRVVIEYNTDLFRESTIERMVGHLEKLLGEIVANPELPVSELAIMSEEEYDVIVREWNEMGRKGELDRTIHGMIENQAGETPDKICLVHGEQRLTFDELNGRANQLAHYLQGEGVKRGDLVGVCMNRTVEMVVSLLAIMKAGGAYVPIDPNYPRDRQEFMIKDAGVETIVTNEEIMSSLEGLAGRIINVEGEREAIGEMAGENPGVEIRSQELAYVLFTSGSTGKPKGVEIEHRSVAALVGWAQEVYERKELEGVLFSTSISFDLSVYELFVTLSLGGRVILAENALELPEMENREEVRLINTVPSAITELLQTGSIPETVRIVNLAGEPLRAELVDRLYETGTIEKVNDLYGPSEDTTYSTRALREKGGREVIGRPISNTRAYVLDEGQRPVPVGVPGELYLGGDGLARGYLNRPELTAEKFVPDPFADGGGRLYRTGDLVRYQSDGNLEFIGRIDHQVKVRGFRIELREIELVLNKHPEVSESVVVAREDTPGEKRLVAYLVTETDVTIKIEEIRGFLKDRLPVYMIPTHYVQLESMPLTPNGKVDRQALPEPEGIRPDLETRFMKPQTEVERILADIWIDVLGINTVGVNDNFFELGGDSILSIQIIARANQMGVQLRPQDMFEAQTISELAANAGKKKVARAEQGLITGQVPLTPIQNHFFEQQYSNPNHWNQAILVNIGLPGVDEAKDREMTMRPIIESALWQVTRHHDMLRARYYQEEKGWVQIIEGDQIEPPVVDWVDLSTLDPADRLAEMEDIASNFQGRLDIKNGPIMRIVLFDFGRDLPSRMLFIIHHLVIDGISWRILMEDFQTAFEQILSNNQVVLPLKTTSYMEWADQLYEFSNSRELKEDLDYWMEIHLSDNTPFPTDLDTGPNIESSVESVRHIIPREETQSILQAVPRVYNTEINEVLLSAIAMAFSPLMRDQALWIQMEGHGREDLSPRETEDKPGNWIDISRTIGWFTTMYPVRLRVNRAHGIGETLIQIKEQVRRIPRRGFTYGILKYLSSDPDLRIPDAKNLIKPSVSFNYLGQVEDAGNLSQSQSTTAVSDKLIIGISDDSVGYVHDPDNQREFLIDVVASVIGGELRIEWMFSRNYHYRSTIESLADNFHSALKKIIEHCLSPDAGGYSPSDFKDVDIDQDELDALLDEITD